MQALLDHLTAWRISLWIQDGALPGVSMSDLRWDWIPAGMPWIDPLKEINADIAAISAGLSSRTQKAVDDADALGDAWDAMQDVIKATAFEVGAVLAPALIPVAKAVVNIAASINRWVRENGSLIRTVAAAGASLMLIGGIVTAVGATIFGLGTVFGLVASGITAITAIIAGLLSPAVLLVAAIAGGA